ncbi:MAG: ribose transport system substrate-binding protein [Caballeronia sp.]|jgi:ribose transport system substrate-binding protein|nr:ribose transport system substrate-binding protein [Caballeronia sp.]MEA3115341.1 ribose transport system substrate-binding protein [Caballeronia sp.]MEA3125143.1 ribose transport system substrate-binding protein [Caballeronia sp.]
MKFGTLLVAIPASLMCASVLAAAPDIGLSNGYFGTEWRNQMIDGAKQQFQTYKAKGIVTDLVVQQSGANTGQQIQDMRNMIRQKVGAIMVDANSATALNGVISEAERSKIPVVSFDQAVSNKYAINVTVDHYKWGQRYAEWIAQQLNGKGNVVVLDGIPGHPAAEARKKAALETFAKYPGIKVVWSGYGEWDEAKAQSVMATVIAAQPKIDAVFTEDAMALGVLRAFENADRRVGVMTGEAQKGFLQEWKKQRDAGNPMKVFVQVNPPDISRTALGIAVRVAQGRKLKPLPDNTYFFPITKTVSEDTLDATLASMKDKPDSYFLGQWLTEPELDALFTQ